MTFVEFLEVIARIAEKQSLQPLDPKYVFLILIFI
jgi:hypothetical protein